MPSCLSNTSLDVTVKVSVDGINIYNQLTLGKAINLDNVVGPDQSVEGLKSKD